MANDLAIYHGSQQIVEVPQFGVGKPYNDYGQGFYCTESSELAKEWACPVKMMVTATVMSFIWTICR